jgi:hypothetical protein
VWFRSQTSYRIRLGFLLLENHPISFVFWTAAWPHRKTLPGFRQRAWDTAPAVRPTGAKTLVTRQPLHRLLACVRLALTLR